MRKTLAGMAAMFIAGAACAATSASYVQQEHLVAQWDGIDNAGRGLHDSATNTWKNLVPGGQDLTLGTGMWADSALMCFGTKAAATGTVHQTFSSLETVFRNLKYDTSVMLFSAGIGNKFFAFGPSHTQWNSTALATTNFTRGTVGSHTLAGVINSAAYIDGSPARHEAYENWWDTGTNYVQVGGRVHPTLGAYAFTGDIYAIRVYTNSISASKAAYNAKIDRQRFKLPARTLTWNVKEDDALASGFFATNGNWKVVEDTNSVPGASDAAVLPAGDYAVTLDDERVLETLAIEDGATLRIALPQDVDATPLTVVKGIEAAEGAGLELEANAFNKAHHRERVTLIECGADSSAALQRLADSLNANLRRVRATVEDGTKLIYTAPPPGGVTISVC